MRLERRREQKNQGPCGEVSPQLIGPEGITPLCLSQSPAGGRALIGWGLVM